ncbi:MAG TPA: hypothetical protein PKY82_15205 [Pyrinomonadaceae bacterium]|nr:hypothetical protein [Pyrinomonadaceae bacterium]
MAKIEWFHSLKEMPNTICFIEIKFELDFFFFRVRENKSIHYLMTDHYFCASEFDF